MKIKGQLVDIHKRTIYPASVTIRDRKIESIELLEEAPDQYIMPGFIDAHVHIESSMLVPSEFARMAVRHGTVATVSDPHEIANVLGMKGVEFMIENGNKVPFKFFFGAPSCVPATDFETAGARLDSTEVETLLDRPDILYLSEMMNYPGVLAEDEEVMRKIQAAHDRGKPVDGHAPGLEGDKAIRYIRAGITTDHECFTEPEARHKLEHGMKISIREGSAAKNFNALIPLIANYPEKIMFCSDDKHPDDLLIGHINQLVARAVDEGYELMDVLRAACLNPVLHYQLPVGTLRQGDPADFILVNDLASFDVLATCINGEMVFENEEVAIHPVDVQPLNHFAAAEKIPTDFVLKPSGSTACVIHALDGELITKKTEIQLPERQENIESLLEKDVIKLTVVNRYQNAHPAVALIQGTGLKTGAIASCVAHDSHNIIAAGVSDKALTRAVNLIIQSKGGISAVSENEDHILPLPIAGIMSHADGPALAGKYAEMDRFAKDVLGSSLKAPFMTLSFMALLVIPALKLSDKGLFDAESFQYTPVFSLK